MRSFPVRATIENGADWLISRMVSPPPTPAKGWCTRIVSSALGTSCPLVPETPVNVNGTATTVAAMAVNKIVGTGRRDDTPRCYVWVSCCRRFDTDYWGLCDY